MPTHEEIINALAVIQITCKQYAKDNGCDSNCPFLVETCCTITDLEPDNWKLNDPETTTWKALL